MMSRYSILVRFLCAAMFSLALMFHPAHAAADSSSSKDARMPVKSSTATRTRAKAPKAVSSPAGREYAGMTVVNACRCVKIESRSRKSGPRYIQVCEGDGSNWM